MKVLPFLLILLSLSAFASNNVNGTCKLSVGENEQVTTIETGERSTATRYINWVDLDKDSYLFGSVTRNLDGKFNDMRLAIHAKNGSGLRQLLANQEINTPDFAFSAVAPSGEIVIYVCNP
jgi:hypothetical protein